MAFAFDEIVHQPELKTLCNSCGYGANIRIRCSELRSRPDWSLQEYWRTNQLAFNTYCPICTAKREE